MKKVAIAFVVLISALSVAMFIGNAGAQRPGVQVSSFGMTQVTLNKEYLRPDGKWLMAFVPSGSSDKHVLISINGHWVTGGDHVDYIAASARVSDTLGPGVQIWAFTDSGRPFPQDTGLIVTILQPGAKFGEPRPIHKPLQLRKP